MIHAYQCKKLNDVNMILIICYFFDVMTMDKNFPNIKCAEHNETRDRNNKIIQNNTISVDEPSIPSIPALNEDENNITMSTKTQ